MYKVMIVLATMVVAPALALSQNFTMPCTRGSEYRSCTSQCETNLKECDTAPANTCIEGSTTCKAAFDGQAACVTTETACFNTCKTDHPCTNKF